MNSKKIIGILIIIILIALGIYYYNSKVGTQISTTPPISKDQTTFDPKNASYEIEGKIVTLKNGTAETPVALDSTSSPQAGSASKITTRYFGNDAVGDLNGDGQKDVAFLITEDGGGSGLFYYAVVALKTPTGYKTTNAFFIGDRIAPQTTEINSSAMELYVNYAERKPGEPMTTAPSVGVTKILKVTSDGVLTGLMQ